MSDLPLSLAAALEPAFVDAFDPPGKLVAGIISGDPLPMSIELLNPDRYA